MVKKSEPFNNPFRAAVEKLRAAKTGDIDGTSNQATGSPPAEHSVSPVFGARSDSDDELWNEAVAGSRPLREGPRRVPPAREERELRAVDDPDAGALAALSDLVAGEAPFDWTQTPEYTEGAAPGVNKELVRRLRGGEFSVQAHLDLHRLGQKDAQIATEKFVRDAHTRGLRCVLLVHGRGLHSEAGGAVLKEKVPGWLARGRLRKLVLAFATARAADGGAGALYVLLRK